MASILLDELWAKDKKGLFKSNDVFVNYSTGFLPLDYLNGFWHEWIDSNGMPHRTPITGLIGGRFVTIFGSSSTGKTTLGDTIGWNIVGELMVDPHTHFVVPKYENGVFIHVDIERTAIMQRLLDVTGADKNDKRLVLQNQHTCIEDVMEMVDNICNVKERAGDAVKYEIDGEMFGSKKPIKVYEPTVIMLDSLPSFVPRDTKFDELEGQMSTNRDVAAISQFYMKMLDRMTEYNITIIAINHIKPKPNTNIYQRPLPQLMMLKDDESLPRGQAPIFYATALFRLNQCGKSKMYTAEEDGFDGFKAILQVAKSKTSFVGGQIPMAFNSRIGYDPVYSLYEFAQSIEIVEGRNPNLYIRGAEAYKFSRKTFRERFLYDQTFNAAILGALKPHLENLLGTKDNITEESKKIAQIPMNKFFTIDRDGNFVPSGVVETDNGLILKTADTAPVNTTESGIILSA